MTLHNTHSIPPATTYFITVTLYLLLTFMLHYIPSHLPTHSYKCNLLLWLMRNLLSIKNNKIMWVDNRGNRELFLHGQWSLYKMLLLHACIVIFKFPDGSKLAF